MEERPEKSDPQQPSLSSRGSMAAFPDRQADSPTHLTVVKLRYLEGGDFLKTIQPLSS